MPRPPVLIACALLFGAALLAMLGAEPARAQTTPHQVLGRMTAAYEARIAGIDDYTVVGNLMTSYHKKYEADGRPYFKTYTEHTDSGSRLGTMQHTLGMEKFYASPGRLAEAARYEGTETVDGRTAHVLFIPEWAAVLGEENAGNRADAGQARNARLYVDAERWVPLRLTFETEVERDGQTHTMKPLLRFTDYREVDGLLYPFHTAVEMEGMDQVVSPEEREKARRGMEELKRRMAEMPEEQRARMEKMMAPQLERLQQMLDEGTFSFTYDVEEIRVNTGLSDDLFEKE